MKLRTFIAADMPSAMKKIREELGEDAVILASQPEHGRKAIRVTAAVERARERTEFTDIRDTLDFAKKRSTQREWQQQFLQVLEFHRTPPKLVDTLKNTAESIDLDSLLVLQKLAAEQSKAIVESKAMSMILEKQFRFAPLPLREAGKKLMFVGPSGVGKTLTVAKLATQLLMDQMPVSVITLDYKRAGGIEQLAAYTDILQLPLHTVTSAEELHGVLRGIPLDHLTLIDTFGCNPYQTGDIALLTRAITSAVEPVLVVQAGLDSAESADIARAFATPTLKRMVATRLDTARRYGNLLAAAETGGLAFSHFTASAKVVEPCAPLPYTTLAEYLLQYRLSTRPHYGENVRHVPVAAE